MRESFEYMVGKNIKCESPSIKVDESEIMADNSSFPQNMDDINNPDSKISAEENDYDPA